MVDLEKPAYRAATKEMLAAVRLVLVRSESLGRALIEIGCAPGKIRIQRTGIPVDEIPFRARTWPGDGAWRFVQACRLIEKKGLKTSLLAFAKFATHYPHSTFTIAGEGPLRAELETHARDLEVGEKVSFPGFVSQSELARVLRSVPHFSSSERAGRGRKSGRRSEFDAGSDGERAAGLRDRARRNSGGDRARPERNSCAGRRSTKRSPPRCWKRPLIRTVTAMARNGAEAVRRNLSKRRKPGSSKIITSKRWERPSRAELL